MRSEFVDEEGKSSQEVISHMAKHIKVLEDEIRHMSETQRKMPEDMESLIKKNVKRASRPMLKRLEKSTTILEEVASDRTRLQGIINLQKVQYEDIRRMVDATTKFEGD